MIIEAWPPVLSHFSLFAGPYGKVGLKYIDGTPCRHSFRVRAEITGAVLFNLSGDTYSGIFVSNADLDVWIGLVILHHDVVIGHMAFYQIAFYDECFPFIIGYNIFKGGY